MDRTLTSKMSKRKREGDCHEELEKMVGNGDAYLGVATGALCFVGPRWNVPEDHHSRVGPDYGQLAGAWIHDCQRGDGQVGRVFRELQPLYDGLERS